MATITPSVLPGYFLDHQTINFSFSNDVTDVAVSTGNIPPSLSKYIAYDTLNPPNPFLAVTEDGRGRVVYDGGFPKFYNVVSHNGATSFAGLNGSCKFLYNAINWVRNNDKWNAGNRKILMLGDCFNDSVYYSIKSTGGDGFRNTLTMVSNLVGMTPTFKNCSDWGGNAAGKIDIRLAELEEYCLVVFFGCHSQGPAGGKPSITAQSINDLVTYRENGNGMIFVTDHGQVHTNIQEASVPGQWGFFSIVNQVISRFGAYFTGDFNRVPVNVGFLRANYGDHPLYANLGNNEEIIAGGSESRVVVTSSPTYAPPNLPAQTTQTNGINYINVMAVLADGSIQTARFTYIIAGEEVLFVNSVSNGIPTVNTGVNVEASGKLLLSVDTNGAALGTMWGEILLNGKRIGAFHEASGVKQYALYPAALTRAAVGDTIEVKVMIPFTYSKTFVVNSPLPDIASMLSQARISKVLSSGLRVSRTSRALDVAIAEINRTSNGGYKPLSVAGQVSTVRKARNKTLPASGATTCALFSTDAAAISAVNATPKPMLNHAINHTTGQLIAWKDGSVRATGTYVKDIYAPGQVFISNGEAGTWTMNASGKLTKTS